jgi:uncharacterized membrane protein YbhN (UPF0104 family)
MMRWLPTVLLVLAVAVLATYVVGHWDDLGQSFRDVLPVVSYLVALTTTINLLYSQRLLLIMRARGLASIGMATWLEIFLVSRFLNLHVPQSAIAYRGARLKQLSGFGYARSVGSSAALSWMETLIVLVLMATATVLGVLSVEKATLRSLQAALAFIAALVAVAPFAVKIALDLVGDRVPTTLGRVVERISAVIDQLSFALRNTGLVVRIVALTLVSIAMQVTWAYLCLDALGSRPTWSEAFLYVGLLQVVGLFRLVPANVGIAEGATGLLAQLLGRSFEEGVAFSLAQRVVVYLFFALTGALHVMAKVPRRVRRAS